MKTWIVAVVVAVIGITAAFTIVWATQPVKGMQVTVAHSSSPELQRSEFVYEIRYTWDGNPELRPWWLVLQDDQGKWVVVETEDFIDGIGSSHSEPQQFTEQWAKGGWSRIKRTRVQKLQHVLFGTRHEFSVEREALQAVIRLTGIQSSAQEKGGDALRALGDAIAQDDQLRELVSIEERTHQPMRSETAQDTQFLDAIHAGDLALVRSLLDEHPELTNARNAYNDTALHVAVSAKEIGVAELLLKKGADINARGDYGMTPLHVAAAGGDRALVEFLLAKGAEVNARSRDGRTPLQVAEYFNRKQIAALLRQRGATE